MIGNYTKSRWTGTLLAAVLITAAALTGLTGCRDTTGTVAPDTASPTISASPSDSAAETSAPDVTGNSSPDIEPSPSPEPTPSEALSPSPVPTLSEVPYPSPVPTPSDAPGPEPAPSSGVARIFYGDWVIQKVLAYGSAGTYGKEDAEVLIGQTLNFSKDAATIINDQPSGKPSAYEKPSYTESTVTQGEFISDFNMSFEKLGFSADSAALYTVSVSGAGGCVLLVKDADTLILCAGGTFFELTRAE